MYWVCIQNSDRTIDSCKINPHLYIQYPREDVIIYMQRKKSLQLRPHRRRAILQHLLGIPLGPLLHQLADDLAAGQLGHLVDEGDAADQPLVLCDARGGPVLDVLGRDFAL